MNRRSAHVLSAVAAILAVVSVLTMAHHAARAQQAPANPWTTTQITQPRELAATLSKSPKPVILHVGFRVLYRSKHIPGSIYAGPASTPEGLETLKQAVHSMPKNADIYLYCGCCPIGKCPNIRPAFQALKAMGFTHLHMVMLQTSFGKDWVARGYPVAGESVPGE